MEDFEYNITNVYKIVDEYMLNSQFPEESKYKLDKLGKFCNIFLQNINSCLAYLNTENSDFAKSKCIANLNNLDKVEKDQRFSPIISHAIDLLTQIPQSNDALNEIKKLESAFYLLFMKRFQRANAALHLNTNQQNRTKHIVESEKESTEYMEYLQKTLNIDIQKPFMDVHPMLLDSKDFRKVDKYLNMKIKNLPICPCENRATVFAYPCHCPVGCSKCWKREPGSEMICPICGIEVQEFVTITD